jgi:hypothetical protein
MSNSITEPSRVSAATSALVFIDRRRGSDRRRLSLRTFLQGGLTPRRRRGRRETDAVSIVDWHEPHLLFLAITILLLSVADAFFTLTLLTRGAEEANPLLQYVLDAHPQLFAGAKMGLTGCGILVLVALARATVFRIIRVSTIIHWFLLGYAALIGYEWWLLRSLT